MAYTNPNISTSSTTFTQLQAGGLSSVLERLITVNGGGTAAPTSAPTLTAAGSGSTLPAATYYVVITETNGIGETTASPASSSQAVTLGQSLVVTFPTLKSGNSARNVYVGTASTGPFTLAASCQTSASYSITAPLPTNSYAVNPPTINTTAFTYVDANNNTVCFALSVIRSAERGKLQGAYNNAAIIVDHWLRGDPISSQAVVAKLRHAHTAFAVIAQAFADIGSLVDANAGTIKPTTNGIGSGTTQRTWP